MVQLSLYSSILLLLVKEMIEVLSLLKDLWMQAPRTLATSHTTTLMSPLSQLASNIIPYS